MISLNTLNTMLEDTNYGISSLYEEKYNDKVRYIGSYKNEPKMFYLKSKNIISGIIGFEMLSKRGIFPIIEKEFVLNDVHSLVMTPISEPLQNRINNKNNINEIGMIKNLLQDLKLRLDIIHGVNMGIDTKLDFDTLDYTEDPLPRILVRPDGYFTIFKTNILIYDVKNKNTNDMIMLINSISIIMNNNIKNGNCFFYKSSNICIPEQCGKDLSIQKSVDDTIYSKTFEGCMGDECRYIMKIYIEPTYEFISLLLNYIYPIVKDYMLPLVSHFECNDVILDYNNKDKHRAYIFVFDKLGYQLVSNIDGSTDKEKIKNNILMTLESLIKNKKMLSGNLYTRTTMYNEDNNSIVFLDFDNYREKEEYNEEDWLESISEDLLSLSNDWNSKYINNPITKEELATII